MNSRIILKDNGDYYCETRIQDGTESWTEKSEEEARKSIKETELFLNGNKIKKKDIPLYREVIQKKFVLVSPVLPAKPDLNMGRPTFISETHDPAKPDLDMGVQKIWECGNPNEEKKG